MGFNDEANSPSEASSSTPLLLPSTTSDTDTSTSTPPLSSNLKTFANIFIAIVGAGVLGLPYTFKRTGWLAGLLMLAAVAALTHHCLMLLVHTRRRLHDDPNSPKLTSFGDLAAAVSGPTGRLAVDVMIVLSQSAFCVSYLLFISDTISHLLFPDYPSGNLIDLKTVLIWTLFPFQVGLSSVKTLTLLAPMSIFADVVDVAAMAVVMVKEVRIYLETKLPLVAFTNWGLLFYGFGVAVYSFEGIGMVLPLEAEAADKDRFGGILALAMGLIASMFALFGVLGYFAFGEETRDIITTNLGSGVVSGIVQIGLCVNLFFSFPVMMNPVYEVVERRFGYRTFSLWRRWLVVVVVALVALYVPNFADFLSLVGSSVCSVLGLVMPAFLHLKVFKDEMGLGWVALDVFVLVVGVAMAVSGTATSLIEIFSIDK